MVKPITALVLAGSGLLQGAITSVQIDGRATATQAVLKYVAPDSNPCTVAVSEDPGFATLVNDVNPALFAGADSDQRPGNLTNGLNRTVVLGRRTVEVALDGKRYSRALQAFTTHSYLITCGSDTATGTFTTANPPLGNGAPDVAVFDSSAFGNYGWPTIDWADQSRSYVDPFTGILLKRATGPGLGSVVVSSTAPTDAIDLSGNWNNPTNVLSNDGKVATYSSASQDPLFTRISLFSIDGTFHTLADPADQRYMIDNLRVRVNGSCSSANAADCTVQVALSKDFGRTAATPYISLPPLPQGAAAESAGPTPLPAPGLFAGWGAQVAREDLATFLGYVNAAGNTVTWVSGDPFKLRWKPGDHINIAGSGCSANGIPGECTIASVNDGQHLTLNETVSTVSNAAFSASNFGFLIRKANGSGTISIDSVAFDYSYSRAAGGVQNGSTEYFSKTTVTVTVDRSGNPAAPRQAYVAMLPQEDGFEGLWAFFPDNGESRYLSPLVYRAVSSPPEDARNGTQACTGRQMSASLDPRQPNSGYCLIPTGGTFQAIAQFVYTGDYREFVGSGDSPVNLTWTNLTPASQGKDVARQVRALYPGYDPPFYAYFSQAGMIGTKMILIAQSQQNTMTVFAVFDVAAQKITQAWDSWSKYPSRWSGLHTAEPSGTMNWVEVFNDPLLGGGSPGSGPFQVGVAAVKGSPDTGMSAALTENCPSGLDARWIAKGAVGAVCVQVTVPAIGGVPGEPANHTPPAVEISKFPTAQNAGWSSPQPMAEGDYMVDPATGVYGEKFLIVKKVINADKSITLELMRNAVPCTGSGAEQNRQAHLPGFHFNMAATNACFGNAYWINFADTHGDNILVDDPVINLMHFDFMRFGDQDAGCFLEGSNIRCGGIPDQIGTPLQYVVLNTPTFAASVAGISDNYIQSHPSARHSEQAPSPAKFYIDGRPFQGATGGMPTLYSYTISLVSGTNNVYKISVLTSVFALDRKRMPVIAWAGRNLMQDKSGPGSLIADSDVWKFCVADNAGECQPSSVAGDLFISAPQVSADGVCIARLTDNHPCIHTTKPYAAQITQVSFEKPDLAGRNWRRITQGFMGYGHQNGYMHGRSTPDGSWVFIPANWVNGLYTPFLAAKLPPLPPGEAVVRDDFTPVTVNVPQADFALNARIRFGYVENGPVNAFYCTTRAEACFTDSWNVSPFLWESEPQHPANCSAGCSFTIPAVPGRVLYYAVERLDSSGTVVATLPVEAVAVP